MIKLVEVAVKKIQFWKQLNMTNTTPSPGLIATQYLKCTPINSAIWIRWAYDRAKETPKAKLKWAEQEVYAFSGFLFVHFWWYLQWSWNYIYPCFFLSNNRCYIKHLRARNRGGKWKLKFSQFLKSWHYCFNCQKTFR